jgi:hypothetical protein
MPTMDIDENAPVITREEILIDAPLGTVWSIHTDISSWSEWLPDIDASTIDLADVAHQLASLKARPTPGYATRTTTRSGTAWRTPTRRSRRLRWRRGGGCA